MSEAKYKIGSEVAILVQVSNGEVILPDGSGIRKATVMKETKGVVEDITIVNNKPIYRLKDVVVYEESILEK